MLSSFSLHLISSHLTLFPCPSCSFLSTLPLLALSVYFNISKDRYTGTFQIQDNVTYKSTSLAQIDSFNWVSVPSCMFSSSFSSPTLLPPLPSPILLLRSHPHIPSLIVLLVNTTIIIGFQFMNASLFINNDVTPLNPLNATTGILISSLPLFLCFYVFFFFDE